MRYLLLIYDDEKAFTTKSQEEIGAVMGAYEKYTEDLRQTAKLEAGEALQPTMTATTVRVKNGETLTTDGPFAETKEQLGGFYMIKANDLDEAIEWAAKIPSAEYGSIEVRPIMEFDHPDH